MLNCINDVKHLHAFGISLSAMVLAHRLPQEDCKVKDGKPTCGEAK